VHEAPHLEPEEDGVAELGARPENSHRERTSGERSGRRRGGHLQPLAHQRRDDRCAERDCRAYTYEGALAGGSGGARGFPVQGAASISAGVEISGKRAAVTGAGGFIGAAVSARLVSEGCEVVGLDVDRDLAARVEATGARFAPANVTDRAALDQALEGVKLLVHTAAYVREWGAMEDFVRVNVGGTVNVLDAAEVAGVERLVHISSVVVYGYVHPGEQDESASRRNCGIPYIDTKSASDRLACRRGAIVIRPGDVYGPGSVPWLIRPAGLLRSGQMALPGGADGTMLPAYIDDLVEAIVLALEKGEPGRAYTVWDGEPVGFDDYFKRLAALVGGRPPRALPRGVLTAAAGLAEMVARARGVPPAFGRHGITLVDRRGTASNRSAREGLGWEPRVGLDEGLRRSAESLDVS
jgi:nucleoside-diphosphate-sugar epimerase